jgi:hypothetical protein
MEEIRKQALTISARTNEMSCHQKRIYAMRFNKIKVCSWIVAVSTICVTPVRADLSSAMDKMVSGATANIQLTGATEITSNRDKVIESLLRIAQASNAKTGTAYFAKQLAIETLGDYRAEKAVDFLISDIAFVEALPIKRGLGDSYVWGLPCARSLIRIGQPSINVIMQRLGKPAKIKELALFGFVIHEIDGEKIGLFRLETALKDIEAVLKMPAGVSEEGLTRRNNLRRIIEIYRDEGWYKTKYLGDESSPGSEPPK